ncbi:MAG: hypothetical protein ACYSVY_09815 [Planctomycetota bacterium]|jgi:hypothetical protein
MQQIAPHPRHKALAAEKRLGAGFDHERTLARFGSRGRISDKQLGRLGFSRLRLPHNADLQVLADQRSLRDQIGHDAVELERGEVVTENPPEGLLAKLGLRHFIQRVNGPVELALPTRVAPGSQERGLLD